jgi:hydrogenase maturation protein HypF
MLRTVHLKKPLATPVLALGAELKNTICCAEGTTAWLSAPLDDLADAECFARFEARVRSMPAECGVRPRLLAYDCHPAYLSTKFASRPDVLPGVPRVAVQHHEAHLAACAAAENVWGDVIGLAFDGTGYGSDGLLWGGEVFAGGLADGFARRGRFRPITLAGGSAAIREPWRLACALVTAACDTPLDAYPRPQDVPDEAWRVVHHLLAQGPGSGIRSSSLGRLFDGVSALIGLCTYAAREAEAAIALEQAAADTSEDPLYDLPWLQTRDGLLECDWRPLVRAVVTDLDTARPPGEIAACFHDSLVVSVTEMLCTALPRPVSGVVLGGGGVFWNARLRDGLRAALSAAGLQLVTPTSLPPSDAGISLGQAVLAGLMRENSLRE